MIVALSTFVILLTLILYSLYCLKITFVLVARIYNYVLFISFSLSGCQIHTPPGYMIDVT